MNKYVYVGLLTLGAIFVLIPVLFLIVYICTGESLGLGRNVATIPLAIIGGGILVNIKDE